MDSALRTLEYWNFFGELRRDFLAAGIPGEEDIGIGVFFAGISRFRPYPLRLALQEKTEGSTDYILKMVSRLMEPGTRCNVYSSGGWERFLGSPANKIAFVPHWESSADGSLSAGIDDNRLVRMMRFERDGRAVYTPQEVNGNFVCMSSSRPPDTSSPGRWLTIKMPAAPWSIPTGLKPLNDKTVAKWIGVHNLLEKRAKLAVVLPDWADVFIHHATRRATSVRALPAFLEAWKTMSLLRSFRESDRWEKAVRRGVYVANGEDLAETAALVRGIFREGQSFPSVKKIFGEVFPQNRFAIIDPLTGKGKEYLPAQPKRIKYRSLLEPDE